MRFAWTVDCAAHNRKVQWLLHMSQPALNLRNNFHEVVDIETAAMSPK